MEIRHGLKPNIHPATKDGKGGVKVRAKIGVEDFEAGGGGGKFVPEAKIWVRNTVCVWINTPIFNELYCISILQLLPYRK